MIKNSAAQVAKHCLSTQRDEPEPREVQNIDRAMAKGALWMILARIGDRGLGFLSMLILVRLLAPSDFGLIAMGMSIIAVCELLGQVGLDVALIQNQDVTRNHYDTAWTLNVILAATTAAVLLMVAVPAAKFYAEPRLLQILLWLAVGSLVSGFENIGTVAFRKDLRFNKEFQFFFGKKLAGFLVTVPLAFALRSYWALIAGIIVSRTAGVGLSYWVQEYRPRFSLAARKELFHFSKWMFTFNVCTVFNSRAADFIVGKIAGAHALGVFNISYELSNLPTSELSAPINRAVFPGYARKSQNPSRLKQGYLDVLGMVAAFGLPAGVGIAAISDRLVPLLLGDRWSETVPLIAVLAFYGILTATRGNAHYVFLALGKPNITTGLVLVQITILLPTLLALSKSHGPMGAGYAYLLTEAVFTPLTFAVLFRLIDLTIGEFVRVIWRPLAAAIFMFTTVSLLGTVLPAEPYNNFAILGGFITSVACGGIAYATCLYALWLWSSRPIGAETRILNTLTSIRVWFRIGTYQP